MKIAYVTAEKYPLVKTGGLADVAYALPKALKANGHDVRVFLPKYLQLEQQYLNDGKFHGSVEFRGEVFNIVSILVNSVTVYLVENQAFFERDSLYECWDKDMQFAIFSEIVLLALKKLDFQADIINCNDWQTGLLPFLLNERYKKDLFYINMKTVYTIHNLRYQGHFDRRSLDYLDYYFEDSYVNFMKVGILNADKITTVSETYAKEIQTDFYGEGLNGFLTMRKNDLVGIVNGIDQDVFDPSKDKDIEYNYDKTSLNKKSLNKLSIQKYFNLPQNRDIATIGIVTRFADQKGLDLIERVVEELLSKNDVQLIVLGSGAKNYEDLFRYLAHKYPDRIGVEIGYNATLANKIYAGVDMFLMPSLYEPCGLSQLISLRHGTIPIVRETGGLNDTVESYDENKGSGNGFSFTNYNAHDMLYTLERAIDFYYNRKVIWSKLMTNAITGDYSWKKSAKKYEELFKSI